MNVGVLGGGQLGRMLAISGHPLGLSFLFLNPEADCPMTPVARGIAAPFDDPAALDRLAAEADVVTFEFENVPAAVTHRLESHVPVFPPPRALEVAQDRLLEKQLFRRLGIATPEFRAVDSRPEFDAAIRALGFPAVLKTRRHGYDGKGQVVLGSAADVGEAWKRLGGTPLILESFIRFRRELSILAVRSRRGEELGYPLVENQHASGILRLSRAPAPGATPALQNAAEELARRILEDLDYAGVLALELFETEDGLLANEIAPRVHNSGHWTIEGAETSQFENHLRAGLGWPLGPTSPVGRSAMLNLIGSLPEIEPVLAVGGVHVHLYGKAPAPGRKLGHLTIRSDSAAEVEEKLRVIERLVGPVSSPAVSLS